MLESNFYTCIDSATAHNTRERVLQDVKIDRGGGGGGGVEIHEFCGNSHGAFA